MIFCIFSRESVLGRGGGVSVCVCGGGMLSEPSLRLLLISNNNAIQLRRFSIYLTETVRTSLL